MNCLKTMSILGLSIFGVSLSNIEAFAESENITASKTTDVRVKFIENKDAAEPINPTNPTDPDADKPIIPVNPLDPDEPVSPGTGGPLSLDFISILDFGEQYISNKNQTYYAKPQYLRDETGQVDFDNPVPNYAQITDNRGGEKGWVLTVRQNGQFKSEKNKRDLDGAQITFMNGEVISNSKSNAPSTVNSTISLVPDEQGASEILMAAKNGEGFGTWIYRMGDLSSMEQSIKLDVPGSTVKEEDSYKTSLIWELKDIPENKI
ncbi:WxL domain-containing protein [Enterococcus sp. MSG3310]|uniref:WxL domain-containing protein n=1 Tax=Enterococcus sp. MSG3310 TaxID=2774835 RepID=UPI003D2FBD4D